MVRKLINFNRCALCLLCLWVNPAVAEELLPLPAQMNYRFSYLEAPIGQLNLDIDQEENLTAKGRVKVSGVAKLFSDFYDDITLNVLGKSPIGNARQFDTRYHNGDGKVNYIWLDYAADGTLRDVKRENIHDMARRDAVTPNLLNQSFDPLSALFVAREKIYEAVQAKIPKVKLYVYDGKRMYQLNFHIYGILDAELNGRVMPVQKIGLTHRVVAGMKDKEKKRAAEFQFPEMVLYFTADQRFVPVYAKQPYIFGAFKVELQ